MYTQLLSASFDFHLPHQLECAIPTERRGIPRDAVKLMVSNRSNNKISNTTFNKITDFLKPGDVLVVNTSGTLKAALTTTLPNGKAGRIHLSTKLSRNVWLAEVREVIGKKTKRFHGLQSAQLLPLPGGGNAELLKPYYPSVSEKAHLQLWEIRFFLPKEVEDYLEAYGQPIRYVQLDQQYPSEYYQTVFAKEKGSSEMPSAGRAFTQGLVAKLVAKGVQFAPILLHTGVSSLEVGEKPYPEFAKVPAATATLVNEAKAEGRRIIAVGTTAIRAIESAVDKYGQVHATTGMTDLVVTPERGMQVVNGMLTGFHEPRASHLLMMEALANREHLALCYREAIKEGYQWHEFGDLHLIL